MPGRNIRNNRIDVHLSRVAAVDPKSRQSPVSVARGGRGTAVVIARAGADRMTMTWCRNPAFWDKKIRIAILTLATFVALC